MSRCQVAQADSTRNPPENPKTRRPRTACLALVAVSGAETGTGPEMLNAISTHLHLRKVNRMVAQAARASFGRSQSAENEPLEDPGRSGDLSAEPEAPNSELHRTLTLHGRDPSACQSPLQTPSSERASCPANGKGVGGVGSNGVIHMQTHRRAANVHPISGCRYRSHPLIRLHRPHHLQSSLPLKLPDIREE